MSEFNALKSLEDAGLIASGPTGQDGGVRDALSTLSEQEVAVLKSVQARMNDAVEAEVGAHSQDNGGMFW